MLKKSEINRKLQITYDEKRERGITIKEQQEEIKTLKKELKNAREQLDEMEKQLKNAKENRVIRALKKVYRKVRI